MNITTIKKAAGTMERHIQTAIQVIIIALIIWVGNTTVDTKDSIIELKTQMVATNKRMDEFSALFDRYLLRSEADARFDVLKERTSENSRRLNLYEVRVKNVEDHH